MLFLELWTILVSGCLKPFSTEVVEAKGRPPESQGTSDYVKRLEGMVFP